MTLKGTLLTASLSVLGLVGSAQAATVCSTGPAKTALQYPTSGPYSSCNCTHASATLNGNILTSATGRLRIFNSGTYGGGQAWGQTYYNSLGGGATSGWVYQKDTGGAYIMLPTPGTLSKDFYSNAPNLKWNGQYRLICAE